jgi:hypothetical protein
MADALSPIEGNVIFYSTADGVVHVGVLYQDETFWLSQKRMAELFGVEVHTINYHLKAIYRSGELEETATVRRIRIVQDEGGRSVTRQTGSMGLRLVGEERERMERRVRSVSGEIKVGSGSRLMMSR